MAGTTYYLMDDGRSMPRWCSSADDGSGGMAFVDMKGRPLVGDHRPVAHVFGQPSDTIRLVPKAVADLERAAAMRYLLRPTSDQGWVAPDGRFFGCGFFGHDDLAHALLRSEVGTLERDGWVRVHAELVRTAGRGPTRRQSETLFELGFHEEGGRFRRAPERLRQAAPPSRAVRPAAPAVVPAGPETRAAPARVLEPDVRVLVDRMAAGEGFDAFVGDYDVHLGFGGRWAWMACAGDVSLGSEETPEALSASAGLDVFATAFDQVEVSYSTGTGVRLDGPAALILEGAARVVRPARP